MSLDSPANHLHADMVENEDHPAWTRPKRNPARNLGDERDQYLELLAEKIHACRDELAVLESQYARIQQVEVDFDPDPATRERITVDARLFDQGTDVSETWREREDSLPRSMVDVQTGGRT